MARLVANTANMNVKDWLELRKEGIGGSDASAVAGVSKYSSPVLVYMDKLGASLPEKPERVKMAARFGNKLEPIVRQTFVEEVNKERAEKGLQPLKVIHRQAIFAHDKYDFIRTNLDGIVYDPDLGPGVFEAKTSHYMLRSEWEGEEVPNAYFIQVQHNMAVMNMSYSWLAVLIGGNDYRHYFIPRDQEFIDYLITLETKFWNDHILQRIPPAMSGLDAEKEMLLSQYPESEGREGYVVTLPNACIEMAEHVDVYKQLSKEYDRLQTAMENEIKAIMGTNEMAFAGSHRINWKTSSNGNRPFKVKVDAQDDRNAFYEKQRKEVEKEVKQVAKERELIEKAAAKQRKADEKARKDAEKALKDTLKAEKAALKLALAAEKEQPEQIEQLEAAI